MKDVVSGTRDATSSDSTGAAKVATYVHSKLVSAGIDANTAGAYALFCQDLFSYIQNNPQVQKALEIYQKGEYGKDVYDVYHGSRMVTQTTTLIRNAGAVGVVSATPRLGVLRAGGAADVLSGFVGLFEGYAKGHGIELNECSLAVSRVALGFAGAMVGGATCNLVLAALSVFAMGKDSYELGKACLPR